LAQQLIEMARELDLAIQLISDDRDVLLGKTS
jgi:hypothetical protein